ncbi:TnpV protein [Coprobacillus cateniformis]
MPAINQPTQILSSHYARMRYNYLKTYHQGYLFSLKANNTLNKHLKEIENQAQVMYDKLMADYLKKYPAPNKETNQIAWVQHMNNLKAIINENILKEIIYS